MNSVYIIDEDTSRQIDPHQISVEQGVVTEVKDTSNNSYPGDKVTLLTPRDFIHVADLNQPLYVGDEIYLDNQSRQKWVVHYGWYEVDGNLPICGWYLQSIPTGRVRSLYLKDLDNLTLVTPRVSFSTPDLVEV